MPAVLASSALGALPPPQSATTCYGSLVKGTPTADQPNPMTYKFSCDGRINAYTIIANRRPSNFDVLDAFSTTADVLDAQGNIVSNQSFGCEGSLPSNGVNCNAGGSGAFMGAWNRATGSFDLTDPYCKTLAPDAKPGTLATPQATVQLIVTDTSGAQDGPFRLAPRSACPRVPDRAPKLTPKKTKARHHRTRA
ncbi:MAG: hypothetical protein QOD66_773 [Solirubrobacteraceae bacterium]|jgi:hypothetical protein|nr:hypothetical protein [Solirubrobacteraceae bacterium]